MDATTTAALIAWAKAEIRAAQLESENARMKNDQFHQGEWNGQAVMATKLLAIIDRRAS